MNHGGYRYRLVLTENLKKGGVDNQFKTECRDLSTKGLYALELLSWNTKKNRLRTEWYVPYPGMALLDENNCHTPI